MSCESRFLPAAGIPPFFLAAIVRPVFPPTFCLAQRALAAAANLARVAADILRLPVLDVERGEAPPRSEERRLSRVSILSVDRDGFFQRVERYIHALWIAAG